MKFSEDAGTLTREEYLAAREGNGKAAPTDTPALAPEASPVDVHGLTRALMSLILAIDGPVTVIVTGGGTRVTMEMDR